MINPDDRNCRSDIARFEADAAGPWRLRVWSSDLFLLLTLCGCVTYGPAPENRSCDRNGSEEQRRAC
jgi:hypothetical protein